jgi:hypothetical protein
MYVIRLQQDNETLWLESTRPERWGSLGQAIRFMTRNESRRAASTVGVSGDWSIEASLERPPPSR